MTKTALLRLAWDYKEAIAGIVATLLGWSAPTPRWLVRLRCFPFARIAAVLRWLARILDGVAGLKVQSSTEAPSAPHPEAAGTTSEPKENP